MHFPLASPLAPPPLRYTWEIYARRLLDLSSVYSFWKHVSNLERSETKRYLEMLYVLRLRPLIKEVRGNKAWFRGGCGCFDDASVGGNPAEHSWSGFLTSGTFRLRRHVLRMHAQQCWAQGALHVLLQGEWSAPLLSLACHSCRCT